MKTKRINSLLQAISKLLIKHRIIEGRLNNIPISGRFLYDSDRTRSIVFSMGDYTYTLARIDKHQNITSIMSLEFIAKAHLSMIQLLHNRYDPYKYHSNK